MIDHKTIQTDSKVKITACSNDVFKHLVGKTGLVGPTSKIDEKRVMVKLDGGMGVYFNNSELEPA